jgi:hypothetical protein
LSLLGLVIPWWGRWVALAVLISSAAAFGAAKMYEHDQAKYDEREAAIKAAGDKQNELTQQAIALHQHLKELADAETQTLREQRDRAQFAANQRLRDDTNRRFVPAATPGPAGPARICTTPDQFDRAIRTAVEGLQHGLATSFLAACGTAVDVATVGADWSRQVEALRKHGKPKPTPPVAPADDGWGKFVPVRR